jgi:MarR family 2-MHQ and catechol resistance regulon transcriptional repressor
MSKKTKIKDTHFIGLMKLVFAIKHSILKDSNLSISIPKIGVLHLIYFGNNPTINDVASFMGVSLPSVSAVVDDLENLGMIKRTRGKDDRRVVHLSITKKGRTFLEKRMSLICRRMKNVFGKLPPSDLEKLLEIYQKIYLIAKNEKSNLLKNKK